jgi:hypothetical protein
MSKHDLIEKLGWYEKAKKKCSELHDLDVFEVDGGTYAKSYLDDALLEYRREHNIFEVGDLVVFKNTEKFKDNMLQVAHIELQKVLDVKSGLNGYTSLDELRHATPYEITKNHRCSHPLNNKKFNGECGLCGLKVHEVVV